MIFEILEVFDILRELYRLYYLQTNRGPVNYINILIILTKSLELKIILLNLKILWSNQILKNHQSEVVIDDYIKLKWLKWGYLI